MGWGLGGWGLLLLLLLIHFALLGPPVLEPDLHLRCGRAEMGGGGDQMAGHEEERRDS